MPAQDIVHRLPCLPLFVTHDLKNNTRHLVQTNMAVSSQSPLPYGKNHIPHQASRNLGFLWSWFPHSLDMLMEKSSKFFESLSMKQEKHLL